MTTTAPTPIITDRLVLSYNGDEWPGTFQLMLTALFTNLLLDDIPMVADITYRSDYDGTLEVLTLVVESVDTQYIYTTDGGAYDRWNDPRGTILSVAV